MSGDDEERRGLRPLPDGPLVSTSADLVKRGLDILAQPSEVTVTELRKRSNAGDAASQLALGRAYSTGHGVDKDDAQAWLWYRRAAEQGHPEAQFELGERYAYGLGVRQDDGEAADWYRKAAEQSHHKAAEALRANDPVDADDQYRLGCDYYLSSRVPRNDAKAAHWYRRAADQGHAEVLAKHDEQRNCLEPIRQGGTPPEPKTAACSATRDSPVASRQPAFGSRRRSATLLQGPRCRTCQEEHF